MIPLLLLNATTPDDGFESRLFGDVMRIGRHLGPSNPADMPSDAECAEAEGIVTMHPAYDAGLPERFPRCRVIVRMGVGYDSVDVPAWGAAGVAVCNVPDYGTSEVADHALALMLALTRGTNAYADRLRHDPQGNWGWPGAPAMRRLRGAVFGVVGLGRIGLAAALRARAFGMELAFYDPYAPNGLEIAVSARRVHSLAALLAITDVLSLHAPLSEETRGMIDAAALAAAKPGMVLVNTARGPIVDTDAVYDALRSGHLAGAGLDVLPEEPPKPGNRLVAAFAANEDWLQGRLVLTPHAAFYSPDSMVDMRRKSIEVVLFYLRDGRLTNCVNLPYLQEKRR
jgi:D-3-phosphoglycerate dehydrogenase/C-terminal binding protein